MNIYEEEDSSMVQDNPVERVRLVMIMWVN